MLDSGYWILDDQRTAERVGTALSRIEYQETSINDLQRVMSQLLHKDHLGTE